MRRTTAVYFAISFPIALIASFTVLKMLPPPHVDSSYLSTQVLELSLQSTRLQMEVYAALVLAFGFACIFFLIGPYEVSPGKKSSLPRSLPLVFFAGLFVLVVGDSSNPFKKGFLLAFGFLLLTLQGLIRSGRLSDTSKRFDVTLRILSIFVILIYFCLFYILPFFQQLITPRVGDLYFYEMHYSMTVLPGFDLVRSGGIERANYGLAMPLLMAGAIHLVSFLGLNVPQLLFGVQLYQVIALGIFSLALFMLNKRNFFLLLGFALVILSPFLSVIESWTPNQIGIRYTPFLVGIVTLVWVMRRKSGGLLSLSITSGILILATPEISAALIFGFATFLVLIRFNQVHPIASVFRTLGLFFSLTFLFLAATDLVITRLFNFGSQKSLFAFVQLFGSGYGGAISRPSAFAGFIVLVASLVLVRAISVAKKGSISRVNAFQAGIATMMLAWLPYYVNRMFESNLWFQVALLILLLAPSFDPTAWKPFLSKERFGSVYLAFVLAIFVGFAYSNSHPLSEYYKSILISHIECQKPFAKVDGVCLTGGDVPLISGQIRYLEAIRDQRDYIVISRLSTKVRVMGFNAGFPWYDPFLDVPRRNDLKAMVNWINIKGPKYVLFDDPAIPIFIGTPKTQQQQSVMNGLVSYRKTSSQSGWEVFERIPSS